MPISSHVHSIHVQMHAPCRLTWVQQLSVDRSRNMASAGSWLRTQDGIWLQTKEEPDNQSNPDAQTILVKYTQVIPHWSHIYAGSLLHQKPFELETIENDDYYTITPNSSYTHQTAFAAETAPTLTKQLSQQKPFTPISLYTRNPLQLIPSHQTAFAPEAILHRTAFTPETFCARKRLYLDKNFDNWSLLHLISFLHHNLYTTPEAFYKSFYTIQLLHQKTFGASDMPEMRKGFCGHVIRLGRITRVSRIWRMKSKVVFDDGFAPPKTRK